MKLWRTTAGKQSPKNNGVTYFEKGKMVKETAYSQEIILPNRGETVAVAVNPKTAALFYDRIWFPKNFFSPDDFGVPDQIRCFGCTEIELGMASLENITGLIISLLKLTIEEKGLENVEKNIQKMKGAESQIKEVLLPISKTGKVPDRVLKLFNILDSKTPLEGRDIIEDMIKKTGVKDLSSLFIKMEDYAEEGRESLLENFEVEYDKIMPLICRDIRNSLSNKYGLNAVTVYNSEEKRKSEYKEGDYDVAVVSLTDLDIVDEDQLSWEQVLEFRKDEDSKLKYKKMVHWLDKEMIGKSRFFIEDEIALKLEEYENSLTKHGIRTVLGTISESLDGKYLAGASGITGSFALAGHPTLGVLAGTGLVVGRVAVKLAHTLLDIDDKERGPNSEISWVYEVKKELSKRDKSV